MTEEDQISLETLRETLNKYSGDIQIRKILNMEDYGVELVIYELKRYETVIIMQHVDNDTPPLINVICKDEDNLDLFT